MAGGFVGSGQVWAERIVNGVGTGLRSFDNASKFEITESAERKDRIGNGLGADYGSALSSIFDKKPTEITIVSNNFNIENVALQLLADTSSADVAVSAIVGESVTCTATKVIAVAGKSLAATVVVKDASSAVVTAEVVSSTLGLIKITDASVNVGDVLTVDYDTLSFHKDVAAGSKYSSIDMRFMLDGVNRDGGGRVIVDVPRVSMTPNDPTDFLKNEFADITLSGVVIKQPALDAYTVTFMS